MLPVNLTSKSTAIRKRNEKTYVERISMSLPPELLAEFDKSMAKAGFSDRSKAIQTALHSFVDEHNQMDGLPKTGAGAIILLYDNHLYDKDTKSTMVQHKFNDIICAVTHLHLSDHNCLECIMIKGDIKRMKELANELTNNRGIKSLKFHFVDVI